MCPLGVVVLGVWFCGTSKKKFCSPTGSFGDLGGGGEFELTGPTEASHVVGEHSTYGDSMIENAVRNCPEVKVKLGGVDVYV